jgi:5-methylcytosine-specific restriction endonuclease McrA
MTADGIHSCSLHPFMAGEVYERLSSRYADVLLRAKQYLSRKRKKIRPGGSMSSTRKQWLLEQESDCPLCGIQFHEGNLDTEHIHSRGLGGLKSSDENRIPMCIPCNQIKGFVTQRLMPKPKDRYKDEYWEAVEAFLLWSELTIDEGLQAGELIPQVHEYFLDARSDKISLPITPPRRAFGRFSSWIPGDPPNYSNNVPLSSTVLSAIRNEEHEQAFAKV